jgi:hypothetical protein
MNSAILIAAMLSGLGAEAMASPLSRFISDALTGPLALDDAFTRPIIQADLSFRAESVFDVFPAEETIGAPNDILTNDPETNGTIIDDSSAFHRIQLDLYRASSSLRVPEPPPMALIALGFGAVGMLALLHHNRGE